MLEHVYTFTLAVEVHFFPAPIEHCFYKIVTPCVKHRCTITPKLTGNFIPTSWP